MASSCARSDLRRLLLQLWAAAQTLPAGFAGSETCKICHEDIYNGFAKDPHHVVDTRRQAGLGRAASCEACHGPGQAHTEGPSADNIRNPAKLDGCGSRQNLSDLPSEPADSGRGGWKAATPITRFRARPATKCMRATNRWWFARPKQRISCASCHLNVWAQFQRPFHHKLPEGAMTCVDCHNPHGSIRPAMLQTFAANEPGCFKCHGDKRGPFTFEHAPVRFEGCQACHEPHGSANPRMLIRAQVRFVCLECHANLPTPFPGRRKSRASCRRHFTICVCRCFRTARCAIRRFMAATWIGIC